MSGDDDDDDEGVITCHPDDGEDACSNRSKNCGRPSEKIAVIFIVLWIDILILKIIIGH